MKKFLATPGPVNIPDFVHKAKQEVYHHRSAEFKKIQKDCCVLLTHFFNNSNPCIIMPSSGTGIMEMALINILSPNDKVICLEFGKFSERFRLIAQTFGCTVISIESPYGTYPSPEQLKKALKDHPDAKVVTTCHSETSTCVLAPIQEYAKIIAPTDTLFVVDAISSVSTSPIDQELNKIDICLGAGHKGFMIAPGLAFLSYYGDKVTRAIKESSLPKFYFNLQQEITTQEDGLVSWTPNISQTLGLHASLHSMLEEGVANIYERHSQLSLLTLQKGEELGLKSVVHPDFVNSLSVSGFFVPDPKEIIQKMYDQDIIITGGQGEFSGKIVRIGHLGSTTLSEMSWVMDCLSKSL